MKSQVTWASGKKGFSGLRKGIEEAMIRDKVSGVQTRAQG